MKVKDYNGNEVDFEIATYYMDSDIREMLHFKMSPCAEQEFYDAYVEEHKKRYNENFTF